MLHKHGSFCFKLKIVNLERNWYIDSTVAVKSNDLCLPLLAATAATGKSNRRRNLNMDSAALWYGEMGRS